MTKGPVTVGPETTVDEALDRMLSGGFRHLPVTDGDTVLGIVSIRDLSRARAEG
jgi:CBS domain-containing protein